MLRAAAERAGCEAVLALAEVKETWDAWPTDEDPWDDYDYEEENEDDEITLGWWTSPDGAGGEPISLYVPTVDVKNFAGNPGIHSDSSAGVLDGQ